MSEIAQPVLLSARATLSIDPPLEFRHKLLQAPFPANVRIADDFEVDGDKGVYRY